MPKTQAHILSLIAALVWPAFAKAATPPSASGHGMNPPHQPADTGIDTSPELANPTDLSVILEGGAIQNHNLAAISRLIALKGQRDEVTVFVSPTYFLGGDQASVGKLVEFLLEHKSQIKVGVHLSAQRVLVENSGVSFRTGPTFWGYPLDITNCHDLCGIEVPLLGYSPKEQNAIIKTAVSTLQSHLGKPIRHSIIEGGFFTKSLASRLRHNGIAVDHTLSGKTAADFYDIRHFPLYGWLEKSGTLRRVSRFDPVPRCVINLGHPEAVGGCYHDGKGPQRLVEHVYHSEAFLRMSGGKLLLSH